MPRSGYLRRERRERRADGAPEQERQESWVANRGRWSGGVYLPPEREEQNQRPSVISQVFRSIAELRSL